MIILNSSIARAARAFTGLSHIAFGRAAGVASRTVYKLEKDGKITPESLDKILKTLRTLGVVMLYDENGLVNGMLFESISGGSDGHHEAETTF